MNRFFTLALAIVLMAHGTASAQIGVGRPPTHAARNRAVAIGIGAGAGFGVGLWAGLHWFDDSINSDRKVWTTAVLFGVAGGVIGYFLSRTSPSRRAVVSGWGSEVVGVGDTVPNVRLHLGRTDVHRAFRGIFSATIDGLSTSEGQLP